MGKGAVENAPEKHASICDALSRCCSCPCSLHIDIRCTPPSSSAMASYLPAMPDARRIRSYIFRLPLATRGLALIITGFYIAKLVLGPWIIEWGAVIPNEISLGTCAWDQCKYRARY